MTANRDPKIWATALGSNFKVDDSNVPAAVPVKSNIGGKSRSSNKDKEGNPDYLSPQETLKNCESLTGSK